MVLWVYVNEVNNILTWNQFDLVNYLPKMSMFITRDGVD